MNENKKSAYLASFFAGFLVVFFVSVFTGRKEAWDSPVYFTVGIPIMMAVIYFVTRKFPDRFWRWPVAMAVGQSLAMSLGNGSLNLWPLSLIAMTICSVPQFVVGLYVSRKATE